MVKSWTFVIFQFCCIVYLLSANEWLILQWTIVFQMLAILLGLWAIFEANKSELSIFPEVKKGASLINTGPYKCIRHPMYTSLLLFFSTTLVHSFTSSNILVYLTLFLTLVLKLNYEEKLLLDNFQGYKDYKKTTWRLIPFIY